jgi:hypothetical protein
MRRRMTMGLSVRAKRLIRAQVRTKREPERTMMAKRAEAKGKRVEKVILCQVNLLINFIKI